jgi:hypothetical protein
LIEAFPSGEGVLYTADPLAIERANSGPDDDNAERVRLFECASERNAESVVSSDSDLLKLGSCMGMPTLTYREPLKNLGEVPEK